MTKFSIKQIMRICILLFCISLLFVSVLLIYRQNILNNDAIIKTAISLDDLDGRDDYILAVDYPVSGSNWLRINENGNELCDIVCPYPPNNSLFDYEFTLRRNTFVFYITGQEIITVNGEEITKYTASDWDVIAPVKHNSIIRDIILPDFITSTDLNK